LTTSVVVENHVGFVAVSQPACKPSVVMLETEMVPSCWLALEVLSTVKVTVAVVPGTSALSLPALL
jgi:hypothetical protein